ncbi:MAG: hypothetical protein KatS3mg105_2136 [Gemmatales bacterium]|nr:MAG: hypothetical protein KatS3mg105_2136 [Gemmatales bacterium]
MAEVRSSVVPFAEEVIGGTLGVVGGTLEVGSLGVRPIAQSAFAVFISDSANCRAAKPQRGGLTSTGKFGRSGESACRYQCEGVQGELHYGRGRFSKNPSQVVTTRVGELRAAIPTAQQGRITMGVAVVEDANGVRSVLVSTSEPRGYLRPGVTLRPGENDGCWNRPHAEADIIAYAEANNLRVIDIGATRPVCVPCQNAINPTGANISTPLRPRPGGNRDW